MEIPTNTGSVRPHLNLGSVLTAITGSGHTPINIVSVQTPVNIGYVQTPINIGCVQTPINVGCVQTPVNIGCVQPNQCDDYGQTLNCVVSDFKNKCLRTPDGHDEPLRLAL